MGQSLVYDEKYSMRRQVERKKRAMTVSFGCCKDELLHVRSGIELVLRPTEEFFNPLRGEGFFLSLRFLSDERKALRGVKAMLQGVVFRTNSRESFPQKQVLFGTKRLQSNCWKDSMLNEQDQAQMRN